MMKHNPPKGVIGPRIPKFCMPISWRTLSRYNDPENNKIPNTKAIKETRIEAFFARENVERNNKARVW